MPASIKLSHVHAGCPGTFLAASPASGEGHVLGRPPQSAECVLHVQGGSLQPPKQSDTLACAPQAMHSICTMPKGLLQGWGGIQSQKSVQMWHHPKTHPMGRISTWGKRIHAGKNMSANSPQPMWPRGLQGIFNKTVVLKLSTPQVFC